MIAPWIIKHLPEHKTYVEPFGGAASVLIRKPPSNAEIYNDLNDELVNFFKVLRNPCTAKLLIDQVKKTPYARKEFELSYMPSSFSIERARRLSVRAAMGFGATGASRPSKTGFRHNVSGGRSPARDFISYPKALERISERLKSVVIEHRPATELFSRYDHPDTLFYVDPPYLWETRCKNAKHQSYAHEMDNDAHHALLDTVVQLKGKVILSGYESDIYNQRLSHWHKITKATTAMNGKPRTEVLWIKPDNH